MLDFPEVMTITDNFKVVTTSHPPSFNVKVMIFGKGYTILQSHTSRLYQHSRIQYDNEGGIV